MAEDEAMNLGLDAFLEMVGLELPDDHTVIYHCTKAVPYFESLATNVFTIPLSGSLIEELGPRGYKGVTALNMWYCGPYIVSEYIEDSTKTLIPNPYYWDQSAKVFDSWTIIKTESNDTVWNLYELGVTNTLTGAIPSATLDTILRDPTSQWYDYICAGPRTTVTYGLYFNYAKKKISDDTMDTEWNLAAANENFRKAFYYGLDLYNLAALLDSVDPDDVILGAMTAPNLVMMPDGTDYSSYVMSLTGFDSNAVKSHHDADLAQEYKEKAMEELSAQGVSFPVHIDMWSGSPQNVQNRYSVWKETIEDGLGTDFVEVEIHTVITSNESEAYNPSYMSIEEQNYGALFSDPTTYLTLLCDDMSGNADYADLYGHIAECENQEIIDQIGTYTQMVREADAITGDHEARLKGLAEAEAFAIEHVLVFPTFLKGATRHVTCINEYTKPSAANDTQKGRFVNVESNADNYTTEEYEAIRSAFYA